MEKFWLIQQHLRRPTAMPYGTHLHIFQKGIRPVWEDASLVEGCQLEIKSEKHQTSKFWEDLLLAMLGEQFSESDFIAGMIMKLKPQWDKVSIWLKDSTNTEAIAKVRAQVVAML